MSGEELVRHRVKLEAMKEALLREGDVEIEPGRKDATAVGTDVDEQPLAEMNQTIASSRNRSRAAVLGQVGLALARLADHPDSFGLCVECEEPIGARRLDLMPYVELCVECQQSRDAPRGAARRSLTDFR
jgi:DnaK suppressor protein